MENKFKFPLKKDNKKLIKNTTKKSKKHKNNNSLNICNNSFIKIKKKFELKFRKSKKTFEQTINIFIKLFIIILLLFLTFKIKYKRNKDSYFVCFLAMAKKENIYVRDSIKYYLKLGVEKFVLGDNNELNTEKLSDVIQDYIDEGIVDIINLTDLAFPQSKFFNITYEKYNQKCKWLAFFDFDEYLEVFFEKNKPLKLQGFLSNETFNKCESIAFNWLIYTDNELLHYDKRPVLERFTEPYYKMWSNIVVKSLIRGNLNKTVFVEGKSPHFPDENLKICDSMGRIIENYNPFTLSPPVFNYGYLKHFSEKTAEESCNKILKKQLEKVPYNIEERVKIFFATNRFSNEKLKIFDKRFNRTFNYDDISKWPHFRGNKGVNDN